ncbi:MAG: HEAT repeat domain-containing protein, partial [Pseudanabaenales cyanobacterium]|nr:HEAT repeat domain-containing protein [Pseudanabaenales cyanobacterium]
MVLTLWIVMVLDILAAIGLTEAGGFFAKAVLLPLLQGSLEDYTKDFFKGCIADAIGLADQEPAQKAMGEALKAFIELVEDELDFRGQTGAEIRDFYQIPLRQFVRDADVKSVLGSAFDPDRRTVDNQLFRVHWRKLNLKALPEGFDWARIGEEYIRKVKRILRSSSDLRELLALHNQAAMRQGIEQLVGIPPDFDLRKYQETLREQYGNLNLESLDTTGVYYNELKLWKMFVPQNVRECQEFSPQIYEHPKEFFRRLPDGKKMNGLENPKVETERHWQIYSEQTVRPVLEVLGNPYAGDDVPNYQTQQYIVILGDPGAGKSSLLRYIAYKWTELPSPQLSRHAIPLMVELRVYNRDKQNGRCQDILSFLHSGNITCRLNQQQLHEKLQSGDAIALFDGLDEVFDPAQREEVITDIHRFTNNYPDVKVIVTSRWVGYKAQRLRDAQFYHFKLEDLEDEQIEEFIQRWHDLTFQDEADKIRKRDRLKKAINHSSAIRELAGNPLLLTMMAILNRNQELPRDRPELYHQASRVLLHQWDVERHLIDSRLDPKTVDCREKQGILRKVAYYMQSSDQGLAGNIISATELENILIEYLKGINIDQPRPVARLMIEQLRKRNFILCHLGENTLGEESYGFVHRTFLEYFCASEIVQRFEKQQSLKFEELRDEIFGQHWPDETWHEVLRLICGMLNVEFAVRLIQFLTQQQIDKSQFLEIGYNISYLHPKGLSNLLLAADCLSDIGGSVTIAKAQEDLLSVLKSEVENSSFRLSDVSARALLERIVQNFQSSGFDAINYLKHLVAEAPHEEVRRPAVVAIGDYFKEDAETLGYLKHLVTEAPHGEVRRPAVDAIGNYFKADAETLGYLKHLVAEAPHEEVRRQAVVAIGNYFKADTETLGYLKHLVTEAPHEDVRRQAV